LKILTQLMPSELHSCMICFISTFLKRILPYFRILQLQFASYPSSLNFYDVNKR
jgi:hypothetical protein